MGSSSKYWDTNQEFHKSKFDKALDYKFFLKTGTESEASRWRSVYDRVALTDDQKGLLSSFTRKMNVLCMVTITCGDCVRQCPILYRIAEASSAIDLRFLNRDENPDLRDHLRLLGGARVPVALFLSEDFFEFARFGDRTLSTYRKMAAEQLGPACPAGIMPPKDDELAILAQEWIDIFERVQLALRLSPMLRERYKD